MTDYQYGDPQYITNYMTYLGTPINGNPDHHVLLFKENKKRHIIIKENITNFYFFMNYIKKYCKESDFKNGNVEQVQKIYNMWKIFKKNGLIA